jgi:predicted O-methyltransferase YrrM
MNIIKLILEKKPTFQVKSGINTEVHSTEQLFYRSKDGIDTSNMERTAYTIDKFIMKYIEQNSSNMVSLETGGGNSTLIFGEKSKKHYTINPDKTGCKLINNFLDENNIDHNITFIEKSSEYALPSITDIIDEESVDICLIDGNHSFPVPIIDWFYINPLLKKNAIIIIDDYQIKAVDMLVDFLKQDSSYSYVKHLGDAVIFKKKSDLKMGWLNQKMNRTFMIVFKERLKIILPEFLLKIIRKLK